MTTTSVFLFRPRFLLLLVYLKIKYSKELSVTLSFPFLIGLESKEKEQKSTVQGDQFRLTFGDRFIGSAISEIQRRREPCPSLQ